MRQKQARSSREGFNTPRHRTIASAILVVAVLVGFATLAFFQAEPPSSSITGAVVGTEEFTQELPPLDDSQGFYVSGEESAEAGLHIQQ